MMAGRRTPHILVAALLVFANSAAIASEPRALSKPKELRAGEWAVQLSTRSQRLFRERLQIWFLREDGSEANDDDLVAFSRAQKFGRPSMLASQPHIFALKAGRYRLVAHLEGCAGLPPAGQTCVVGKDEMPTRRYTGDVSSFTVEAGKVTRAGEYILEYLRDKIDVYDRLAQIRWRAFANPLVNGFAGLNSGPAPESPQAFESKVHCDTLRTGFMKPDLPPFEC
jgi:hypothetical protein